MQGKGPSYHLSRWWYEGTAVPYYGDEDGDGQDQDPEARFCGCINTEVLRYLGTYCTSLARAAPFPHPLSSITTDLSGRP